MRAWLIRHGESESNAGLPTNGPSSAPLTGVGAEQAEHVAGAFTESPTLIVTSPFVRAAQTAQPTIKRFPGVPIVEWPVQEFTYLGDLHGPLTTAEQRRPHAESYWERCDPAYVNGGDGESFAELIRRVDALLEALAARPGDELVAVFTHGLFMRALIWALIRGAVGAAVGATAPTAVDAELMRGFRSFCDSYVVPNGCIVELRIDPGAVPYVVCGGVGHLAGGALTGIGGRPGWKRRVGSS